MVISYHNCVDICRNTKCICYIGNSLIINRK